MNLFQIATQGTNEEDWFPEGYGRSTPEPEPARLFSESEPAPMRYTRQTFDDAFDAAASEYGVDASILRGMAWAESRFRPDVIDGRVKSSAGAAGLMQFMPGTAKQYGINPLDPIESIFGAAAMMRDHLDRFDGDYQKAVAAYNWGPNRSAYQAGDWAKRLPKETQGYVLSVLEFADGLDSGSVMQSGRPQALPKDVQASAAGAGRGAVNPPVVQPKQGRSVAEMGGDTVRSVAQGLLDVAALPGVAYSAVTGDWDTGYLNAIRGTQEVLQDQKSQALKDEATTLQERLKTAEGWREKFAVAAVDTLTNPALLADTLSRSVPGMLAGGVAGRAAGAAADGLGNAALGQAISRGSETAARVAVAAKNAAPALASGTAVGTAAVQQGASVANEVYDNLMKLPVHAFAGEPEFAGLVSRFGEDKAKSILASAAANRALAVGTATSVAAMKLIPGGDAVEKLFLPRSLKGEAAQAVAGTSLLTRPLTQGMSGGVLSQAAELLVKGGGAAGRESLSEGLEEGSGAVAKGLELSRAGVSVNLAEMAGEAAGQGAAAGLVMGKVAGAREAFATPVAPRVEDQPTTPQVPGLPVQADVQPVAPAGSPDAVNVVDRIAALVGAQPQSVEGVQVSAGEPAQPMPPVIPSNLNATPSANLGARIEGLAGPGFDASSVFSLAGVAGQAQKSVTRQEGASRENGDAAASINRSSGAVNPLLSDDEVAMLADFENLYRSDLKADIRQRLGLAPKAQSDAQQAAEKKGVTPFKAFLRDAGINSTLASDITGAGAMDANRKLPGAFRKNGRQLDELVQLAKEQGFMSQADEDASTDNGGVNRLVQLIQQEFAGTPVQRMSDMQQGAQDLADAAGRNELELKASALGLGSVVQDLPTDRLASVISRIERRLGRPVRTDFATRKLSRTESNAERQAILMADRVERSRQQYDASLQDFAVADHSIQDAVLDVLTDADGNAEIVYMRAVEAAEAADTLNGQWSDQNAEIDTRRAGPVQKDSREVGASEPSGAGQGVGDPETNSPEARAGATSQEGLNTYTPAEVAARQDAAGRQEVDAQTEQVRRENELAAEQFTLTSEDGRRDSTASLFDQAVEVAPKASAPKPAPRTTKLAGERAEELDALRAEADLMGALADLADIFGKNVRANMMPEQEQRLLPVLTRVMDAAFRLGHIKFKQAARFALEQIRSRISPDVAEQLTLEHLQGAYIGMSGRYKGQGAESIAQVGSVLSKGEIEERGGDVSSTGERVEPGEQTPAEDGAIRSADGDDSRANRQGNGPSAVPVEDGGTGRVDSTGLAGDGAALDGKRGHQPGGAGRRGGAQRVAGSDFGTGSGGDGGAGVQAQSVGEKPVEGASDGSLADPQDLSVLRADKANIDATLPALLPGQREDVFKAETVFQRPQGFGMLFTNGTGTGKTFTGLGIIKRYVMEGRSNVLILAPKAEIIAAWIKSGRVLDLDIKALDDTSSAGDGVTITTYANLGENDTLADREWDLVVADESHYLSSNEQGERTKALDTLRAITLNPRGAYKLALMRHRDLHQEALSLSEQAKTARMSDDQREWHRAEALEDAAGAAFKRFQELHDAIKDEVANAQGPARPRTVLLSASPFAWEKSVDYAEGFLFNYGEPGQVESARGYNGGSDYDRFFMRHFGYRMRYNKLTHPEGSVDRGLMQRQFNGWLKSLGVLSGRRLEVDADYDRRFILVDSRIGNRIDEAIRWGWSQDMESQASQTEAEKIEMRARRELSEHLGKRLDYLTRSYILESIKAEASVAHIRQQLALGRKVVVFHDFKKGWSGTNPFDVRSDADATNSPAMEKVVTDFRREFADLIAFDFSRMLGPIATFKSAFGGQLDINNGDESKADNLMAIERFNDDASGPRVILVQSAKAEGWSGHDTTGKHQRVLLNLGLPTRPFTSIQQEGRIYRTGQVTDAVMRYFNTGTGWERTAFAQKIAERASAAENLAMGEEARALKQAFIQAFEDADDFPPGHEGEGRGGKEIDRAAANLLTEFDSAKTFYWAQQKKTSRTKAQEGKDYFATPEPLGLKMVEWLGLGEGETGMEPSAGHGAIARWFPDHITALAVEPSPELRSRLSLVFNGSHATARGMDFESLDVGGNKADGIAMNPPFGLGGKTAMDHLEKAVRHLREGGRVVAIIPTGPSADKRLEALVQSEAWKTVYRVADIALPSVTFERAGTGVMTRVVVFDKGVVPSGQPRNVDLSSIQDISELFNRLEHLDLPGRSKLDAKTKVNPVVENSGSAEPEGGHSFVKHTTGRGNVLRGVIHKNLSQAQAKEIDPYTFKKNGGWFIRDRYLDASGAIRVDGGGVQPAMSPEEAARFLAALKAKRATKESVKAAISRVVNGLGLLPNGLGRIVVATKEEIKQEWEPLIGPKQLDSSSLGQAMGFYDPRSKTIFLIADHIRAGEEEAVVLHELMHKHGVPVLGQEGWDRLHGAISAWAQAPEKSEERQIYDAAARRVANSMPEQVDEVAYSSAELFPYAIQIAVERGVQPSYKAESGSVARWLATVRGVINQVWQKITGKAGRFEVQDMVNLAYGMAQRENPEHAGELDGVLGFTASDQYDAGGVNFSRGDETGRSRWRDEVGRLQFAPGRVLSDWLGDKAGPMLTRVGLKSASKPLKRQLRQMRLDVERAQKTAASVAKEMATFSQDEREMVSDLVEQTVKAGVLPPGHAVKLAAVINDTMGRQTDELIELGMLSEESAERLRGKYLPRYYKSKMRGLASRDVWADAMKKLTRRTRLMQGVKGKHLKGRGLWQAVPADHLADFIELGWELRDPGYVDGESAVAHVWRDFTEEEREQMGEIKDAGFRFVMGYMQTQRDIALGRMFKRMAEDDSLSSRVATEGMDVRVPDSVVEGTGAKVYGALAGRFVSRDTLSHLTAFNELHSDTMVAYRHALSLWKEGKTVLNPVSHLNNTVSNMTMAHLAGVGYHRADKYLGAMRDFIQGAALLQEAEDEGLFLGSFNRAELAESLPSELADLVRQQEGTITKAVNTAMNVMSFWLRKPLGKAYEFGDSFFKYLIYKDARGRGLAPQDAIDYAHKFIFTYDDLPSGARKVRDFAIPFFSYTYKAAPVLLETALTHPVRMLLPAAMLWTATAVAYAFKDAGDDPWDDVVMRMLKDEKFRSQILDAIRHDQEHLPKWMQGATAFGTPKTMYAGEDKTTGLPRYIDVSRMIPGGDLFDATPNAGGIPWLQPLTPNHPVITSLMAMLGNKDLHTGRDLVDVSDTRGEAAAKRGEWIYRQMAPAIAAGNYHVDRAMNALAHSQGGEIAWLPQDLRKHWTGIGRDELPVLPGYAALQTVGVKVRPMDMDRSEMFAEHEKDKLVRDLQAKIRSLNRLANKGVISDEVRDERSELHREKIQRLRDGLTVDGDAR